MDKYGQIETNEEEIKRKEKVVFKDAILGRRALQSSGSQYCRIFDIGRNIIIVWEKILIPTTMHFLYLSNGSKTELVYLDLGIGCLIGSRYSFSRYMSLYIFVINSLIGCVIE